MKCQYCGTEVIVVSDDLHVKSRSEKTCIKCGKEITKGYLAFCPFCAATLEGQDVVDITQCDNLLKGRFCRVLVNDEDTRILREVECTNQKTNSCCYICPDQKMCNIRCHCLDKIRKE